MRIVFRAAAVLAASVLASSAVAATPDHLQCFKIKDSAAKAKYTATLTPGDDTFAVAPGCEISVPAKQLCVETEPGGVAPTPPGSPEAPAARQYLCYKTKCPKDQPTGTGTDQFGAHTISVKSTSFVCAPLELPIHCQDGALGAGESDVDCGGECTPCDAGGDCTTDLDCSTGVCSSAVCQAPTCSDVTHNGLETDVDCGGTACPDCADGQGCAGAGDCASGVCTGSVCQVPSCADAVQNGDESDLDCGGSCPDCGLVSSCNSNSDCVSGYCGGGACAMPSCSDSVRNGTESGVDCGGVCTGCVLGGACGDDLDCASRVCSSGTCATCASNGDCLGSDFCSSGSCVATLGTACSSGATCPLGFCVDGVCCDSACGSTCEACTYAKTLSAPSGTCAPVATGLDPDLECAGTDACTAGACAPAVITGTSSVAILRADTCGSAQGRNCESLIGDVVADAVRTTYAVDFGITNSGALRSDLSCPAAGNAVCDPSAPPPHVLTAGEIALTIPFGNQVTTATVTGDVLKAVLENGVSQGPGVGGFPQVSGLCFTYDIAAPAGSRVVAAVRQAVSGTCTGPALNLTVAASYTIAGNDFMTREGDGYPNLAAISTFEDSVWEAVTGYVSAVTPLAPVLEGRITCSDSNGATAPNCP
jgi:hypothetical protein